MWKKNFTLRIDAHPEDGFQTVGVSQDGDYWVICGVGGQELRLPNDDNVLSQIIDICELLINHEDNPLNFVTQVGSCCPKCNSPNPKLHPAVQFEGEVQLCDHGWHVTDEMVDKILSETEPCPPEQFERVLKRFKEKLKVQQLEEETAT